MTIPDTDEPTPPGTEPWRNDASRDDARKSDAGKSDDAGGDDAGSAKAAGRAASPGDNVVYPNIFASGRAAFPDGSHLDTARRDAPVRDPAMRDPAMRDQAAAQMPALRSLADRAMHDEPPKRLTALHSYWFCLGDGQPPERSLINPAAIAPLLPDLLLLEKDGTDRRLRYRLTGTRIDHWNGCNLTGRYLDDVARADTTGITDFMRRHVEQALLSRRAYIGHYDWYAAPPGLPPVDPLLPGPGHPGSAQRGALLSNPFAGNSLAGKSVAGSFPPGSHRRWPPSAIPGVGALLQRPVRLWLGLFPLSVDGRIRQCLAIAEHDGLPTDTTPAPWILDGGRSGGFIPGRWRDA